MRTSCLINCFNYREYVAEAMESVLAQSTPFDELIVVDDGSTDDSVEVIRRAIEAHGAHPTRVELVEKSNGGQLSSFHAGLAASTGELVYFLDADDAFESGYLEQTLAVYGERPDIGFVTTGHRRFGDSDDVRVDGRGSRDLGYSVLNALVRRGSVGNMTSTLSMRREVLERFMPLPDRFLDDWRICADEVLIYGTSVAGAAKFYVGEALVRYRHHGSNADLGRRSTPRRDYQKKAATTRLLAYLARLEDRSVELMADTLHREFCTIERPSGRELRQYLGILKRLRLPLMRAQGMKLTMVRHFLSERG